MTQLDSNLYDIRRLKNGYICIYILVLQIISNSVFYIYQNDLKLLNGSLELRLQKQTRNSELPVLKIQACAAYSVVHRLQIKSHIQQMQAFMISTVCDFSNPFYNHLDPIYNIMSGENWSDPSLILVSTTMSRTQYNGTKSIQESQSICNLLIRSQLVFQFQCKQLLSGNHYENKM